MKRHQDHTTAKHGLKYTVVVAFPISSETDPLVLQGEIEAAVGLRPEYAHSSPDRPARRLLAWDRIHTQDEAAKCLGTAKAVLERSVPWGAGVVYGDCGCAQKCFPPRMMHTLETVVLSPERRVEMLLSEDGFLFGEVAG